MTGNMKLKYILSAFALVALTVASCTDSLPGDLANATLDKSYVRLAEEGGSATIKLTTSDAWTFDVECEYDTSYTDAVKGKVKEKITRKQLEYVENTWLSVSPLSGKGDATITLSAPKTDSPRSLDLLLKVGDATQHVIVRQEEVTSAEIPVSTCAQVAEGAGTFRVKGVCVSIVSDYYGNWFLQDEKGDVVYIYGTVDATGSYNWSSFGIATGDVVTVEGPKSAKYTGTWGGKEVPELENVSVIEVEKALLAADKSQIAISSDAHDFEVLLTQKGTGISFKSESDWLTIKDNGYTVNSKGKYVFTVSATENTGARRTGTLTFTSSALDSEGNLKTSTVPVTIIQLVPETKGDIADIVEAISESTSSKTPAPFDVTIPKTTVTYVNGSNTFLENENGAVLVYASGLGLSVGQTIEGRVFGAGCTYKNLPEITVLDLSLAKVGKAPLNPAELPQPKEVTLDDLLKNWDKYFSRRIVVKGLEITDGIAATYEVVDPETGKKVSGDRSGKASDGTNEIALYVQVKEYLELQEGTKFDAVCIPTINGSNKQLGIWSAKDVTVEE